MAMYAANFFEMDDRSKPLASIGSVAQSASMPGKNRYVREPSMVRSMPNGRASALTVMECRSPKAVKVTGIEAAVGDWRVASGVLRLR